MKTCEYDGDVSGEPRSHPWTDTVEANAGRYHDLKASPGLIRTSLEDLLPWSEYAAVQQFYGLLERLNGPDSRLESNDCAFTGPHAESAMPKRLQCEGRVMILFRDLGANLARARVEALKDALHLELQAVDPSLEWGLVGTSLHPTRYLALPGAQRGYQLMLSFWAWGDAEAEAMGNLERVLRNLAQALRSVG